MFSLKAWNLEWVEMQREMERERGGERGRGREGLTGWPGARPRGGPLALPCIGGGLPDCRAPSSRPHLPLTEQSASPDSLITPTPAGGPFPPLLGAALGMEEPTNPNNWPQIPREIGVPINILSSPESISFPAFLPKRSQGTMGQVQPM